MLSACDCVRVDLGYVTCMTDSKVSFVRPQDVCYLNGKLYQCLFSQWFRHDNKGTDIHTELYFQRSLGSGHLMETTPMADINEIDRFDRLI